MFWVGTDHALWHAWELPAGGWSAPFSLGGYLTSCIHGDANADGRLEIFVRPAGADLDHICSDLAGGAEG